MAKAEFIRGFLFSTKFLMLHLATPIIELSAHLWAFKEHTKVNQIQYNALRFFFGLSYCCLLRDSCLVPIQMRLDYMSWYRVCNLPQEMSTHESLHLGYKDSRCRQKESDITI